MVGEPEELTEEIPQRWHLSIPYQGIWMGQVLRGFNQ